MWPERKMNKVLNSPDINQRICCIPKGKTLIKEVILKLSISDKLRIENFSYLAPALS